MTTMSSVPDLCSVTQHFDKVTDRSANEMQADQSDIGYHQTDIHSIVGLLRTIANMYNTKLYVNYNFS